MDPRRSLVFFLASHPANPSPEIAGTPVSDRGPRLEVPSLPPPIRALQDDFRILVNHCVREALAKNLTARGSLSRFARDRAREAQVTGAIGLAAAEIALGLVAGHRRRLRQGRASRVPYVRTPFVRLPKSCFHLDPATGKLRLSLRRGEWSSVTLRTSRYHQSVLSDPAHRLTQLHLGQRHAVAIYATTPAPEFTPTSLVALDTNERSLDGVRVTPQGASFVRVAFPELRTIQRVHLERRRSLGRKKATDRRLQRRLLGREGRRERHRVQSRLHEITRAVVDRLAADRSALALEDLTGLPRPRRRRVGSSPSRPVPARSRAFRGRLSRWPQGELHRQLAYKARDRGVPVLWLSPYRSSVTCPRCGAISEHRSRVGTRFACGSCGWTLDRQLNAGVNLGLTALRRTAGLGGLRLDPDALLDEVVSPLYRTARGRPAREERTGRERLGPGPT